MLSRVEKFSFAITELYRQIRKIESYAMTRYSLKGHSAFYLLALLKYENGITAAALAEKCGRNKAEVSRTLKAMTDQGYVTKKGSDNGNGYRARLLLTERGKTVASEIAELGQKIVLRVGSDISEDEHETFYKVLDAICDKMSMMADREIEDYVNEE